MVAEVKEFTGGRVDDVPRMLRNLADEIEAGEHGEVSALYVVLPREDDTPQLFGMGADAGNVSTMHFELSLACHRIMSMLLRRA